MRHASNILISIYLILNGSEWLYLSRKQELLPILGRTGILLRVQDRGWPKYCSWGWSRLSSKRGATFSAMAIIASGLALLLSAAFTHTSPAISLAAFIILVAFNATVAFGLEGADQMATLVLFANALTAIIPRSEWLADIFIMIQLILSYGVAGIAKLLSADWRSGRALGMVVSTRSMGLGISPMFLSSPTLARMVCLSIILFELFWFAAPFNKQLAVGLMGCSVIFHVANAWIMGLNLFPWAFLSAYPLAISAIYRLHS